MARKEKLTGIRWCQISGKLSKSSSVPSFTLFQTGDIAMKFTTNARSATWWPRLELIQVTSYTTSWPNLEPIQVTPPSN